MKTLAIMADVVNGVYFTEQNFFDVACNDEKAVLVDSFGEFYEYLDDGITVYFDITDIENIFDNDNLNRIARVYGIHGLNEENLISHSNILDAEVENADLYAGDWIREDSSIKEFYRFIAM